MKLFFASFAIALCVFVQTSFAIPPNYVVTTTTGVSIVPGTTDIGNHCDDCVTNGVSMPFAFTFYDQTFTSVNISSNGNLQFSSSHNDTSSCAAFDGINVIAPGWTDLWTAGTGAGQGVFTSVSGSFPNRIFNIEWRVTYCCGDNGPPTVNFEARLYEGEQRIDFIYGANSGVNGVGVQRDTGSQFTSVGCGVALASGTQYTFRPADCVTPPTNMVGWFPGDNNTIDLINGNNATLHNGAGYGPGEVSGAFNFDGVDDYVSFGSTLGNFGTGNFTVDFWIRTTSTRDEEIIGKRPVCNHASFWNMRLKAGGNIQVELDQDASGTNYNLLTGVAAVNDGAFHHVTLIRAGVTAALYIDGALDVSGSTSGVTNISNGSELIAGNGPCVGSGSNFFTGLLDEIEIFNRALSVTEITDIYNAGGAGKCKPQGLYAADGGAQNPNCHLYLLNPADGSVVRDIGPIGFSVTGLAFDPTTGILYGATGGFTPTPPRRSIITIDPATGAGTLIGPEVSGGPLADVTFTSDGTFYGWGEATDDLYTVNKSTGAATKVGESSTGTFGSGISANSGNILYFGGKGGADGTLTIVNRSTGQVSNVTTFSGAPLPSDSLNAFAFDPNDILYASNGGDNSGSSVAHLVTINTTTAVITDRGSTLPLLDAIAFGPAHVCDQNPPVITTPGNIDARAQKKKVNGQKGAFVFFNVSAVDPEDGPVAAIASPPSGSFFPVGSTVVTVTATDSCGNTSIAFFTVSVSRKKH